MTQKNVWIKGSFFSAKSFMDAKSTLIASGMTKEKDNIMQGYEPQQDNTGILYSWKNMPVAYYDVPTLNNMVFSKKLWESIHENPFIKASLKNKCFWGEDQHRDSSEVLLENVAIRVNDFWIGDNNLVLADVDLMDTPKGLTIYSLAKTGMIGTSSRGFGDLIDIGNGLQRVDEDSYLAVDWDCVGFPAVPAAMAVSTSGDIVKEGVESLNDLEKGLREQISSMIEQAHEKNPDNEWLTMMFNAMNPEPKKETFLMASSLDPRKAFQRKYPTNKDARGAFRK